ncbi:FtsK/SpoIIIE domain-containing protein [Polymorphospora sp. NPDC051019]|uniref:FtsK/SpoIIIE domain-containing protein n=1 Tax=Polymorphospora sp. NPDC051019 TaxID=3155725 RepID=UPI00342B5C79
MERELRLAVPGGEKALTVRAGSRATAHDLARALAEQGGAAASPTGLWVAGEPVPGQTPLAELALPTGVRLSLSGESAAPVGTGTVPGDRELAVVGGRAEIASVPIPGDGTLLIGRGAEADLVLSDPEVSRTHARLRADEEGAGELSDTGSRNGTAWRGVRLVAPVVVRPGDTFAVGETVLAVRAATPSDAPVDVAADGEVVRYNRPPRISFRPAAVRLTVPRRPERPRRVRFPLLMMLVPLLLAGVMYVVYPTAGYFLIFLALSPVLVLANVLSDRRNGGKEHRAALREYERQRTELTDRLDALAQEQGRSWREALPDPGRLLRIAGRPTRRLFERRPSDEDFLRIRVGLAPRPVDAVLAGQEGRSTGSPEEDDPVVPPLVDHAPAAVDLAAVGVLGLAGPREPLLATVRALLAHLAALHAPHDVGLVVLTGQAEAAEWEWVTWLPHTLPHTAELACRRMVATDAEQVRARLAELRRVVDERQAERQATLRSEPVVGRRLVVVADGARRLRGLPGLAELLTEGPDGGVYAVCLDADETNLPAECAATVVVTSTSGTRARLRRPGLPVTESVLLDRLSVAHATELAHALAPLRVLGGHWGAGGGLPDTVRLLELAGLGRDPGPEAVERRWATGGRTTEVLLGVGPDGPVTVDLRRDGPHALVAGTSGAGKSELLQTLVVGLALGNAPDALSLMLVDYKGGSAFAECRQLPHCVGMITDLDGHLVSRALESLGAELRRREALLADAGAKDIEEYWSTGAGLPRLVIVIDEFASLVEEVPEFVTGVVGIGMRGRSLGVHVVLATQRPAGVVNAELRANLNLRICLRVTSAGDSGDVIDVPDAARLSRHQPGRAYLRAGHTDLTLLQAARIGWPRERAGTADPAVVTVSPRTVGELGRLRPASDGQPSDDGAADETDLTVLVAAIRQAARRVGVATPPSPWLPPLPELLVADQLPAPDPTGPDSPVAVAIGLADHPRRQVQEPYVLDLARTGPVLVAGMARSGRSTALRVLATGLATRSGPADVHLYVLDQGNQALAQLAGLPHCGAYVTGAETDRTERVLAFLAAEIDRRQRVLAADSFGSLAEQRSAAAGEALPYLVLLLDRYESFVARYVDRDGGRLVDLLDGLLRRGPAVGVVAVLATDRSGFTHRLAGAVATRIVLAHPDRDALAAYGLNPRQVPAHLPPGRAIVLPGHVDVQVALLDADPDGTAQAAAVDRLAAEARHRATGIEAHALPARVDPLPDTITVAQATALRTEPVRARPTTITVGVGGNHLAPVDLDLVELGHGFLVAGPSRSGRTGALLALVSSLGGGPSASADGTGSGTAAPTLVLVCPRRSPLYLAATQLGAAALLTGDEPPGTLRSLRADSSAPVVVVVDDAELLATSGMARELEELARRGRDEGDHLVAAVAIEDLHRSRHGGWLGLLCRNRAGLLLNPSSGDGEVFELRLPRSIDGGWPPGRGLLVVPGRTMPVQVPVAEAVPAG